MGTCWYCYWSHVEDNKASVLLKDWNIYMDRYYWHHVHHNDDGSVVGKCPKYGKGQEK